MKTVYPDENNVVLNENSVEIKPCINRESKSDELAIKLYIFHDVNMNFLVVVTPPSIYQDLSMSHFKLELVFKETLCLCILSQSKLFL